MGINKPLDKLYKIKPFSKGLPYLHPNWDGKSKKARAINEKYFNYRDNKINLTVDRKVNSKIRAFFSLEKKIEKFYEYNRPFTYNGVIFSRDPDYTRPILTYRDYPDSSRNLRKEVNEKLKWLEKEWYKLENEVWKLTKAGTIDLK